MLDASIAPLKQIRIILVETSHTGNMGSVARAMKTMGLTNLYLVNPIIKPDSQSVALAAGASDVIQQVTITTSLDEALADCHLVIGTSARTRSLSSTLLDARQCGEKLVTAIEQNRQMHVALLFGRERIGLTNEELQKCHYHVMIPANTEYASLNLAMAVQLLSYEIRMAYLVSHCQEKHNAYPETNNNQLPSMAEIEYFYQHLQQTLCTIGFIKENHPNTVMNRLRRLFNRVNIEKQEINILRGVLTAIERYTIK